MGNLQGRGNRTRRKLNYNSYYNSELKTRNLLRKHPEMKRVSKTLERGSYLGEITTSRAPLTPGIAVPFITPTTTPSDLQKYYVIEETTNIDLAAQSFEEVMNESEDGEILAIEAITQSPIVTIEVVIYGMGNTPNIINNYNIDEMIRRGRGLTPGDVEELPGGRSKDTVGIPRRYYPYISRYKKDTLVDYLGDSRAFFIFTYEPAIPLPYSSIIVNVKNTGTSGNQHIDSVNIHRRVYESPVRDKLAGTPIDSAALFKQIADEQKAAEEQQPVNEELPPNTSPYVANIIKNQNLPPPPPEVEIIASDDDF